MPTSFAEDIMERGQLGPTVRTVDPVSTADKSILDDAPASISTVEPHHPDPSFLRRALGTILSVFQNKERKAKHAKLIVSMKQRPEGYPRLATLIGSDEKFMLYRRFGYLQSRILLRRQDELRDLEDQLGRLDDKIAKRRPILLQSREKDAAKSKEHTELLDIIENRYKAYAELMVTSHTLANLEQPQKRDYTNVVTYFDEEEPVVTEERYIHKQLDLITLKPGRETTLLDTAVEKLLQVFSCRLMRAIFSPLEIRTKPVPNQSKVMRLDRTRVDFVVSIIILSSVLTLLIVPVYVLWYLTQAPNPHSSSNIGIIISVLLVFTLVFTVVLSLFTRAKRHEILASAAAYCAVLVVFVGNVGQIS